MAVNASVFSLSPNTYASLFAQVVLGWLIGVAIMLFYANPALGLVVIFASIRWIPWEIARISRLNKLQTESAKK
jgi:hypothetical protein